MASADLLLHPVRLRIVKAFLGDRALTTRQLSAELADVPSGTLYRHMARLAKAGVLQVVTERRVRGALERTYTLGLYAARMQPADLATMTPDDHANAFMAFVAGLLGDFDRYLATEHQDSAREGAGYHVAALWLSDTEFLGLLRDLSAVIQPRLAKGPASGRRRRVFYTVSLPGLEALGRAEARGFPPSRRRANGEGEPAETELRAAN